MTIYHVACKGMEATGLNPRQMHDLASALNNRGITPFVEHCPGIYSTCICPGTTITDMLSIIDRDIMGLEKI